MKIALVTCDALGDYDNGVENEDERLIRYLSHKGNEIVPQSWTDASVDWKSYDFLLVKSPWDYFDKPIAFSEWLHEMESQGIVMFNSATTIRWNANKMYMQEIADAGFPVVPFQMLPKNSHFEAKVFFELFNTKTLIFKPLVGGGAKNTFKISPENKGVTEENANELLKNEAYLVQPFVSEIVENGEVSLVYFGGKFSHAVQKMPKAGDFRVQHFFGGQILPIAPSGELRQLGERIIQDFAADTLYGRVDLVETATGFQLMELELIEPFLFLFTNPLADDNYYDALLRISREEKQQAL